MKALSVLILGLTIFASAVGAAERNIPKDLSKVRGFNYTAANVAASPRHHIDHWLHYNRAVTEFDLDLAKRLNLNQARVFVPYDAYLADKESLRDNLQHFVRACHERGIGVMPVVVDTRRDDFKQGDVACGPRVGRLSCEDTGK